MPPEENSAVEAVTSELLAVGHTSGRVKLDQPPPRPPILETDYANTPLPNRQGDWAARAAGNELWMRGPGGARHAWTNVHQPGNEYDSPITGLSGIIVSEPHVSSTDMPFTHPFGNDYEFHVAPDEAYEELAAPGMDDAYRKATKAAKKEFGRDVPGVVGMEMEHKLIPESFSLKKGDRVCLFGRWIVDAGHEDFHTEIHSPLLMVGARAGQSGQQIRNSIQPLANQQNLPGLDATYVQFTSRPYLVSQEFGDGALFEHLVKEIAKVFAFLSNEIEAHPNQMRMPFEGIQFPTFKIRPPSGRRHPDDKLQFSYRVARNSPSIAFQAIRGNDGESVRVITVFNDASYDPPPWPDVVHHHVTVGELIDMDPDLAPTLIGGVFASLLASPYAAYVELKGVQADKYPRAPEPVNRNENVVIDINDHLHTGDIPIHPENVYPLVGTLVIQWLRHIPATTTTKPAAAANISGQQTKPNGQRQQKRKK